MAELAVGIITGCLPVMPKFVQHVGPKLHSAFSTARSSPATDSDKMFASTILTKIKNPAGKHGTRLGPSDADTLSYASRPHGEYCMLDEFGASQDRENRDTMLTATGGAATRRDDLEYGSRES